jgi:hypothetical protein
MAWDWGGAGQGAMSGASAGAAFGPWGAAIGGLGGGLLGGLTGGGEEDPMKEARKYLEQIPGMGKQYYNPFIDRGNRAGNLLEGEYGKLLDPSAFMDNIMKNYKMSAGAQYQQDKLGKGIANTAAAGGFAGTPEAQRQYGEMADQIMSGDMQQYLSNALGIYNRGLGGEEGFADRGYDATKSLVDLLGGTLSSEAGLGFQGASQHNADRQSWLNAMSKAFSTGAGALNGSSWGKSFGGGG